MAADRDTTPTGPTAVPGAGPADDQATVSAALGKLRAFVEGLPPAERQVLAALLAPAVASAYEPSADDLEHAEHGDHGDVVGFSMRTELDSWTPRELPVALADQIRTMQWQISVHPADDA